MSAAASLPEHPIWTHIAHRLLVESGTKLASGKAHRRIELDCAGLTEHQLAMVLAVRTRCPSCGDTVCPFRRRFGKSAGRASRPGRLFLALCCPLDVRISCSRGKAASEALGRLAGAVAAHGQRMPAPPTSPATAPTPRSPARPAPQAPQRELNQLGLRGLL